MSVKLSCPACNAAFILPAVPEARRAECPRCREAFPVRAFEEVPDAAGPPPAPGGPSAEPKGRGVPRALVAVGLLVAVGGGTYCAYRERPAPPEPAVPAAPAGAVHERFPTRYLPAECNLAFGIDLAAARALAARADQDPRAFLERAGLPPAVPDALARAGLPADQLARVAGGARVGGEGDPIVFALAVETERPFDREGFLKRVKAKPTQTPNLWSVALDRVPLPLLVAVPDPRVLVFGLDAERDFAALAGGGFPRDRVRDWLELLPPRAAAWAVADDAGDWTAKPLVKLVAQSPEAKRVLAAAGPFRGGLVAVDGDALAVRVRTADAATAERVRAYLAARAREVPGAVAGGTGTGAHYEGPHDPLAALALVGRFVADAGR